MTSINLHEIGIRIRKQREYLGLKREELAEKIEVTTKFCADIELGVKGMSLQTLLNISDTLKISTDYILKGEDANSSTSEIHRMLAVCENDKLKTAEELLKIFLRS